MWLLVSKIGQRYQEAEYRKSIRQKRLSIGLVLGQKRKRIRIKIDFNQNSNNKKRDTI